MNTHQKEIAEEIEGLKSNLVLAIQDNKKLKEENKKLFEAKDEMADQANNHIKELVEEYKALAAKYLKVFHGLEKTLESPLNDNDKEALKALENFLSQIDSTLPLFKLLFGKELKVNADDDVVHRAKKSNTFNRKKNRFRKKLLRI